MKKWIFCLLLPLLYWGVHWSKANDILPPLEIMPGLRVAGQMIPYGHNIPQIKRLEVQSQLHNGSWEIQLQIELAGQLSSYAYLLNEDGQYLESWSLVQGAGHRHLQWSCPANARQETGYFLILSDDGYWLEELVMDGR